jgi:hypothetical protein
MVPVGRMHGFKWNDVLCRTYMINHFLVGKHLEQ